MNWTLKNDDTHIADFLDVKMEVNYMTTHWAWIITDPDNVPMAGSFLNGVFPESEQDARDLCIKYAKKYIRDPEKYCLELEQRVHQKFSMNLELNGMQAIVISMMLYEHSKNGIHLSNADIKDQDMIHDIHQISKSMIGHWRDFSEQFELSRK